MVPRENVDVGAVPGLKVQEQSSPATHKGGVKNAHEPQKTRDLILGHCHPAALFFSKQANART